MRLHEASRNLNIGIDTIADFLISMGMPLEDRNLNSRLRDEQCSMLYKVFGNKPQFKPKRIYTSREKAEVQAVLDELHHKHSKNTPKQSSKETKASKKAKRKRQREEELRQLRGQKVKLKIKWFYNQILYTKGFENLFTEGRVQLSDVYYAGNRLNGYWAEYLLKSCKTKTEFIVVEPQVVIGNDNNTYARLRYDITPDTSWQYLFEHLRPGMEFVGKVIDINDHQYVVKYSLNSNYFIWGYINKEEYAIGYDVNSTICVRIKSIASNLFAPFVFTSKTQFQEIKEPSPYSENESKNNPSNDDNDFIKWRENQRKELDNQREQLRAAVFGNSQRDFIEGNTTGANKKPEICIDDTNSQSQKQVKTIKCEATFFEDYEVKGLKLNDFLYNKKAKTFEIFLNSTGSIVLRYKLLIALADLINAYHNANLILGDIDPSNFELISNDPLVLKMLDDSGTNYKTNMIHSSEDMHFIAPEVQQHLSPVTPMSECYSFASLVYQMLTGEEYNITNDFRKTIYVAPSVLDILFQSLGTDAMLRPKMSKWSDALRLGLDELVYCSQCHQWHILNSSGCCSLCNNKSYLSVSLQVGNYGEAERYCVEQNRMEIKPTIVGKTNGNLIITENTSKILYGYHFGMSVKKDQPIAVVTITRCNSNKDITLHIIPISGVMFTSLDDNYNQKDEPFEDETDIEITGEKLYQTMFLVESESFNNKILKLCHI